MKCYYALPAMLIGAAVVVIQPQLSIALSPKQVSDMAKQFTIRIDGIGIGSGIIIDRKGDTYFVLTNHHVVEEPGRYEILAPDGDRYPVYYGKELPNLDLAVLEFTSKKNYNTAKFGNSDQLTEGMTVYAVGWARIPGADQPSYQFTKGYIRSRLQNPDQGYALGYDNEAIPGMSGGPLLDENGLVVGINGRATEPDISTRTVLRLGIPINTFVAARGNLRTLSTREQPTTNQQPTINTAQSGKQRSPESLISSGAGRAQTGNYQEAMKAYEAALRINPNHPDAYFQRAIAHYDLKNYQAAFEDLNQVVRLTPNSSVAYMNRGLTQDLLQRNQEALQDYSQAIALNPDYAAAYLNRGALKNELQDYQGGISDLNQAIRLKPDYALAYLNRGDAYIGLQDYQKAIADLDEAIKLQPNSAVAYSRRGFAYRQLKEYNKAVLDYNIAIGIQPDYTSAYFGRAFVRRRLQDERGALADYSKIISLSPEFAEAYYNRGLIYQQLAANEKALLDFQKAADLYQQQGKTEYYQDTIQRIRELQNQKIFKIPKQMLNKYIGKL
ncbi:tetratricopeptide repeat protein [Tolypothrix sp. FACHB-123]|uniref:tetratricopeptide repeat-containing S1 family peptidase n=1 Tax=Tolypothrix sp. FACHB-123 TaxID=2692868 RepID=UPI001684D168|nr:serine protease [Tolypothrix sp. FACHB-123]MBD2355601.1 tetratricopeptide repeat protein [Tolypothrix sp. FACHB-123]